MLVVRRFCAHVTDLLLEAEDVLIEVELQLLVAEVDAELLEAVPLERLEPEDVEHADDVRVVLGLRGVVAREVFFNDSKKPTNSNQTTGIWSTNASARSGRASEPNKRGRTPMRPAVCV